MIRAFFGVGLEERDRTRITDWRDQACSCEGKPVPPANLHITLAFIGDIKRTALEHIADAAESYFAMNVIGGGTLVLDTVGYWSKPGIFWIGPSQWPQTLNRLSQKLGHLSCAAGGKRNNRPFQPHVTLHRRCRNPPAAPLYEPNVSLSYAHCTLFESHQGKKGVSYHALERWPLQPQ